MSYNIPSIDPANNDSLVGTISFAFNKMMQNINGMMPAEVIAYDRENNRVQVQLLITMITTEGTQVPRPQIASLPVLILGGGNISLSFPINTGDLGWVFAADRDISLFLQSYAQSPPNSNRIKNFSDGLFIPDAMKSYNYSADTNGYFKLQSNDGKMSISMGKSTTAPHPNEIDIVADRVNINVNSGAGFLAVNGNIVATGTITPGPIPPFPP